MKNLNLNMNNLTLMVNNTLCIRTSGSGYALFRYKS